MKGESLPFAKLVTALFDRGVWARMSAAARALYPVLLRFSDGQFKGVYPGASRLMELTGFKHKKSIREARNELISLGLITATRGTGRTNTYYQFRFDWVGDTAGYPTGALQSPPGEAGRAPQGVPGHPLRMDLEGPTHNQIHISITNHVQSGIPAELENLRKRFGEERVRRALSECDLAGLDGNPANVESILSGKRRLWSATREKLAGMISPDSLRLIEEGLLADDGSSLRFDAGLPAHLKKILTRHTGRVEFVHSTEKPAAK
ncbi:MAG: helix-turn-helix domain-containing protein [Leptospirales bacterium]|nr:helix-turn-helix domain-containing protein [Leptospirales bacterium]